MNIKEIAESITEDPNVILEADPTRRDFLKRSAGTAAAAAKGDLLGAVTSAAGVQKPSIQSLIQGYNPSEDPYARYSDEQLSGMINDNNFINAVPYARLVRIAANYWMKPTTLDLSNKDMEFGWECTENHARDALEHLTGLLPLRFEEEFIKLSKSDGRIRPIDNLVGIFKKLIGTMGQDELEEAGLIDVIQSKWSPTDRIGLKSQNAHFSSSLVGAIADRISLFACGDRGDGILPDEECCDTFGCNEEELKHHPASASGMSIITQAAKRLSSVANDIGVKTTPSDIENIADASLVSWDAEYEVSESPARVLKYFENLFAKFAVKVPRSSIISGLKGIVDRARNWATSYDASQEVWDKLVDKKAEEYRAKTSKLKKQKGKAKTPKSGIEKGRTLSKSGETGGLPPLQPRSITRRQRDFPYKDTSLTSKAESPYPTFESKLDRELSTINELFFRPSYKYKVTIEYKNHESPGKPIIITRVVEADSANEAFAYVHTSYCEYNKLYPDNLDMIYDFLVIREDGKEFTPRSKGFDYGSGWASEWHETSAVDPLKHISDEELIDTPERQWITKIPYSRLLNIIKSAKPSSANWNSQYNIGYAKGELIVKTSMAATYICQGLQPSPGGYNDHLARKVHETISNIELLAYLLSAMKGAGINFSKRDEELLKESMIDSIRTNDSCNWSGKVADALSRVCSKIGLNISAGDISRKYEEISNLNNDDDDFEDENDYTLE